MRKWFRKRDTLLREAFCAYDRARVNGEGNEENFSRGQRNDEFCGVRYSEQECPPEFEDKIYYLIEKLPIRNPRRRAKQICFGVLLGIFICILGFCFVAYCRNKPARDTKVVRDVYNMALERIRSGGADGMEWCISKEGIIYHKVPLTTEECDLLEKKKVSFEMSGEKAVCAYNNLSTLFFGENTLPEDTQTYYNKLFEQCGDVYKLADRNSSYYIMIKDQTGQTALGKYQGYAFFEKEDTIFEDGDKPFFEGKAFGTKELLENVLGIHSWNDIRNVTLERVKAVSKSNSEKMVALWNGKEEKKWFWEYFSRKHEIWDCFRYNGLSKEKQQRLQQEGRPIKEYAELFWEEITEIAPKNCFYLEIENQNHEIMILGVVCKNDKVQLYIEPVGNVLEQTFQPCILLSREEQKMLAKLIRKVEKQ